MPINFNEVFLALAILGGLSANRVSTENGSIFLQDSLGHKTALTQSGLDSDPWLSADGTVVVFLRSSAEDMFRTSVYELDLRTQNSRLLFVGPAEYQGRQSTYFGQPELNEAHDTLFLLSKEYATESALIAIRLTNGEASLISNHVVGYDLITCKAYRGNLIVLKRHEDILSRPFFLYWLYSAAGSELGLAGGGELTPADLDVLREGTCAAGDQLPRDRTYSSDPLAEGAVRVDRATMERLLVQYVAPTYPEGPQKEHVQGDVELEVRIAPDGAVQAVNLVSGPPQFVEAAKAAVRLWKYHPTASSGHAVTVVTTVIVHFRLPQKNGSNVFPEPAGWNPGWGILVPGLVF